MCAMQMTAIIASSTWNTAVTAVYVRPQGNRCAQSSRLDRNPANGIDHLAVKVSSTHAVLGF